VKRDPEKAKRKEAPSLRGTVFYKMSGSGNDFVMLDGRWTTPGKWPPERTVAICDRRQGVGADGLVILTPVDGNSVRMDFWNCDGSPAAMCGNAALCSTRLAVFLEMVPSTGMTLVTGAGSFPARCVGDGNLAELNLPAFQVPQPVSGIAPEPGEGSFHLSTVGVPHLVVIVPDVDRVDVVRRGRELRFHPAVGPEGANVNFVSPATADPEGIIPIRTYERGVEGETLACGTGAVATAVTLALVASATLPVSLRTASGLNLRVNARISGPMADHVWLAGEGRLVFRGLL
jgi:diaminopimelate epimerase